jgi:hypothetical protein
MIGFIDTLYTPLRTTSNYSAITDEPHEAWCQDKQTGGKPPVAKQLWLTELVSCSGEMT